MNLDKELIEWIYRYKDKFGYPFPIYCVYGKSNKEAVDIIRHYIETGEEFHSDIPDDAVV